MTSLLPASFQLITGNMYYRIKATDSLCMQAGGESSGATLTLATCSSSVRRQHFTFVPASGIFTQPGESGIKSVYGHNIRLRRSWDGLPSSYCLGITPGTTGNGARIQVNQCNSDNVAQLFRLAKAYSTYGYNVGR